MLAAKSYFHIILLFAKGEQPCKPDKPHKIPFFKHLIGKNDSKYIYKNSIITSRPLPGKFDKDKFKITTIAK